MNMRCGGALKWTLVIATVFMAGLFVVDRAHAQDCDAGTVCSNYGELMQYLQSNERRNPEYRIVQVRDNRPTLMPAHGQYGESCYFFAMAPVLDYLGFTQFVPDSHYMYQMSYAASDGLHDYRYDVGYHLSAEHLMGLSTHFESIENFCETRSGRLVCEPFECPPSKPSCPLDHFYADVAKTTLNTAPISCNSLFDAGEEYGTCSNLANTYGQWLDTVGNGCGDGSSDRCRCSADASCGMYWFANQVLVPYAGCNDMKRFEPRPDSTAEILHMRRVIKAFIDHNLPVPVAVHEGGHFMVLIGYLDLDAEGLPTKAILTDAYDRYLIAALASGWDQPSDNSLLKLLPWNHHLDGACEAGAWASQLDAQARRDGLRAALRLCSLPSGWTAQCTVPRVYGTQIVCEDDRVAEQTYFAYDGDLFITDENNVDCDKVILRYTDGQHGIRSATIRRFWYSPVEDRWQTASNQLFRPDSLRTEAVGNGLPGPVSIVEWDRVWPEGNWLIADGLRDTYTKRRATIELVLNDGVTKKIELTPPNTYGVNLDCIDNDHVIASYRYEADHGVFRSADARFTDKQFFAEGRNRSCDSVKVRVNLGQGETMVGATLQRMYYSATDGEWRPAQGLWYPDRNAIVPDALTGHSRSLIWDEVWMDDHWLVAENVGSGSDYGDRKTVLRLYDGSMNLLREIEIAPY